MSQRHEIASGLIMALPRSPGEAVHWWRFEDGALVESGIDVNPLDASLFDISAPDQRLIALLPASLSRAEWTAAAPGLADRQAEALAARTLGEAAIGGLADTHAAARLYRIETIEASADGPYPAQRPLLAILVARAELARGLALLADLGIDPTHVVPACCVALQAAASGPQAAVATVGGERIFVGDGLLMPAEPSLERILAPDSDPVEIAPQQVETALCAIVRDPPMTMLSGPFARRRRLPSVHARQWKTLGWLLAGIVVATLLIGLVTIWRYSHAADEADALALAGIEAVLGSQPDLGTAETALDQRLARTGRGAAVFSVPLSALYQAMQPVPQVSVRQIGFTSDGTLAVSLAAPDAAPINQMVRSLEDAGYKVTGDSRVDATGSAVFDISVRGY